MSTSNAAFENNVDKTSRHLGGNYEKAVADAVEYLIRGSKPDGSGWSDFPTNRSGESTSWVTAHVLSQVGSLLPPRFARTILDSLLTQRQQNGGWGFSESVPPDCDSTVHALWAMLKLNATHLDISESIEFVLSHQTQQGGFSTYKDGLSLVRYRGTGDESNYQGWTQPHVCVTAVVLEVLSQFSEDIPPQVLDNALDFLLETQKAEGYWESYWWRSKYFATARIIKYLNAIDDSRVESALAKALNWLCASVDAEGFWSNGYDLGNPCPLSTAHCVNALIGIDTRLDLILKATSWLVAHQNTAGSWTGAPVLQIPPPHLKNPYDLMNWNIGGRGVGSCCVDEKRIYTSTVAANAIHTFISDGKSGLW